MRFERDDRILRCPLIVHVPSIYREGKSTREACFWMGYVRLMVAFCLLLLDVRRIGWSSILFDYPQ